MKVNTLLSYLLGNELGFELLEQENPDKSSYDSQDKNKKQEILDKQKDIEKETKPKLTSLQKEVLRNGRRAIKDFLKDGKLKEKNKEFVQKYLEGLKYTNMPEWEKMATLLGDYNFSGKIEEMVDNSDYKRESKFFSKVFGEYKKWALGRETARRDSSGVWWEQISNIILDVFDTIQDKSTIYKNIRDAFSTYANIKDISVTDIDSFIDVFSNDPELYLKLNQFINHTGLEIADIITYWKNETYKQLAEDYTNINTITKKAEENADKTLSWPKGAEVRNDFTNALNTSKKEIEKEITDINQTQLTEPQKRYLLYLNNPNSDINISDVSADDKKIVEDLRQKQQQLNLQNTAVKTLIEDKWLFEQVVRQELTAGILMLSTIKDGKLVTFNDPNTWEPWSKVRLQAVSLDYGLNYKLWENWWTFNTWVGAWWVPLWNIITPSWRAWLWKTFQLGEWQFLSVWLLISWWINSGSRWAGAWLWVWWSNRINNGGLKKNFTDYTTKSITWWAWAYMDLSRALSYGASIWYKENKEEGIDEKMHILTEWIGSIFDSLLSEVDSSKSQEENKQTIKDKIKELYPKTKDTKKSNLQMDIFVDKIVSVVSLLGDSFKDIKDKDGNNIDQKFARGKISEKLTHMILNNRRNEQYESLKKFSIDGFNINVAAIAFWFTNPVLWLAAVTPNFKIRSGVIYVEDEQTKTRSQEDKDNLIWAFEKTDTDVVDYLNKTLKTKDWSKIELSEDNKTISIPESVYKNTPISVNTKYKDLLSSYTKVENWTWKLPSWVWLTIHSESKARWWANKELKLFANKNEGKQSFQTLSANEISNFKWELTQDMPEQLQHYTQESIQAWFDEIDKKVWPDLSTYFDVEYKDGKIYFYNKQSLSPDGKPTLSWPFDTKWILVFEKSWDNINITQSSKEWPLWFEFIDKDVNWTKLNFETPKLSTDYLNFLKQFEPNWYFDYGKIRDLKYVKAKKWDHQLDGIKVAWVVQQWKYKNGNPKYNWNNAKLVWQDSFKEFSLALNSNNYKTAAEKANELLKSNNQTELFNQDMINDLYDFNIKLTWERAAKTISENSIQYTRDPNKIISNRTNRFEDKRTDATWIPVDTVKWYRDSVSLPEKQDLKVNSFDGIGVILWYEDRLDLAQWEKNTNAKYIINPRYIGEKSTIEDPTIKKWSIEKLIKNDYVKQNLINSIYKKLNIALPSQTKDLEDTIINSIKDGKELDINWSKYILDPKLYFAFYPDCVNESLLLDFEIKNKDNAQVGKESDIDKNYINNSLVANRAVNASAGANVALWRGLLQEPKNITNPDVIDSETWPGVTDIKYETVDWVYTTTVTYKDGKILIIWDTQDGSPMSWNYWYYEWNDFISVSSWLGSNSLNWQSFNSLPANVQWHINDPASAGVTVVPPTNTPIETWKNRWNLVQATKFWVDDHWKDLLNNFVTVAKKNSEDYKKSKQSDQNSKR